MKIGIDFGSTTTDVVLLNKKITCLYTIHSYDYNIKKLLKKVKVDLKKVKEIRITGGRSSLLKIKNVNGIPVKKVNEIKAIGLGGSFLTKKKNCIVVSMGTGTCMVDIKNNKPKHIGGTGIGGGTLIGLCKNTLNSNNIEKIIKLAGKGNLNNTDIKVKEAIGGEIGIVPEYVTASNLGKLMNKKAKKEDLALAIMTLIGQSIAMMLVYAAKANKQKDIVLTGKTSQLKPIQKIIKSVTNRFNINLIIPKKAEYATAIGAVISK